MQELYIFYGHRILMDNKKSIKKYTDVNKGVDFYPK